MNNAVLAALIAGLGTYFVTALGAATVIICLLYTSDAADE